MARREAGLRGQRRRRGRRRRRRRTKNSARLERRRPLLGLGHPRRLLLLLPGPVPYPVKGELVVLLGLGEIVVGGGGGRRRRDGGGRKGAGGAAVATVAAAEGEERRGHGGVSRTTARDGYCIADSSRALPPAAAVSHQRGGAERDDGSRGPHGRGGARRACG